MPSIVPIGEFVADAGYPGYPGLEGDAPPWLTQPYAPFRAGDQDRFWFLDFHWPRGVTPMGLIGMADGYARGTQYAAEHLPLPSGRGITVRSAGTHIYASEIPLDPNADNTDRAARFSAAMPAFIRDFQRIWGDRRTEIENDWRRLQRTDLASMSRPQLREHVLAARAHHRRAWEIHFEMMYPLLANYLAFRGLCAELGIDPNEVSKFVECGDTQILETDRELWRLTTAARNAGLEAIFAATQPEQLIATLTKAGGKAAAWLAKFRDFLDTHGWRTEGIDDVSLPSWAENPTSPVGTIKTFLQKKVPHDFAAARTAAQEARETALDAARAKLTREEQEVFDAGLASVRAANFTWWNEEHDYYIDLRAHLPMRRACLAVAESLGTDEPDDTLFMFWPEMMSALDGQTDIGSYKGLIADRRQYFDHWQDRRLTMPKVLGAIPDTVSDPILIEIFGVNRHFLHAVRAGGRADADGEVLELRGVPAASGQARGPARVLTSSDNLHRIQPGEVLVCESTSPNWTPAFAKIAACVCDGGGSLSHAAIVGREYGVPTVTGVGLATLQIRDGDEVAVDGSAGLVTVYRREHDATTEAPI